MLRHIPGQKSITRSDLFCDPISGGLGNSFWLLISLDTSIGISNTYSMKKNSDLRDLNNVGERIQWIRETLELSKALVSRETGIPFSSYAGREYGSRTHYFEEYKAMADFFNSKWKLLKKTPKFKNQKIVRITTMWIMFGAYDE